jgi:hypothetical protein
VTWEELIKPEMASHSNKTVTFKMKTRILPRIQDGSPSWVGVGGEACQESSSPELKKSEYKKKGKLRNINKKREN